MAAVTRLSLTLDPMGISHFFSENTKQILTKLVRNLRQVVLYQVCEIGADRKFNMAARANYAF